MPWVGELSGRSSREEFGEIYSKCMMWNYQKSSKNIKNKQINHQIHGWCRKMRSPITGGRNAKV